MIEISRRDFAVLVASTALVGALAAPAAAQTIAPFDLASRDPVLVKVRAAVVAAAKARDFKALAPHLDPKVELDYGGGSGIPELQKRLAKDSPLWDELLWVVEHGGRFERDGSFYAPYTFHANSKLDVFEAGVVIGETEARTEPRRDAPVAAKFKNNIVRVVDWKRTDATPAPFYKRQDWVQIELADKRKVWAEAKHVRSVVDYRCGFVKKRGVWKITQFIAGD